MTSPLTRLTAAAVVALTVATQPAFAMGGFTDESAAIWTQRVDNIVRIATSDDLTADNMGPRLKSACKGVTGEIMKVGNHIPTWAQQGELQFCNAVDGLVNPLYRKSMCKAFKGSISALKKADLRKDPEPVVRSAAKLQIVAEQMLEAMKENRAC